MKQKEMNNIKAAKGKNKFFGFLQKQQARFGIAITGPLLLSADYK